MALDITTLNEIKNKIQIKLDKLKVQGLCFTDEERGLIDGKELAFEEVIDYLNEIIKSESKEK